MNWLLIILAAPLLAQGPWIRLFDGRSTEGWRAPITEGFPNDCWRLEDGALRPLPDASQLDLWTAKTYRNFEFEFEFKLSPGANGGIKYLIQYGVPMRYRGGDKWLDARKTEPQPGDVYIEASAGIEYQIVDDATREGQDPKRRTASIYSLVAPKDPAPVGPGVYHKGRIVVRGDHIEHWLNGRKVLQVTLGSPEMDAAWASCKRSDIQRLKPLTKRESAMAITHHGSLVWYRNLRIRELP